MPKYTATWKLTDNRTFTVDAEAESPEHAAEYLFVVCNGESPTQDTGRWRLMGHRSMSVGDNVQIQGPDLPENGESYYCASAGWQKSTELHPRSMEDRMERLGRGESDNLVWPRPPRSDTSDIEPDTLGL